MKHPSFGPAAGAALLALLGLIFATVALATPAWSRVPGSGLSTWTPYLSHVQSAPVTTASTLYLGLWQWCLNYGDEMDAFSCSEALDRSVPAFGRKRCKGYFQASRALAALTVGFALLSFLLCALVAMKVMKWKPELFWKAPKALAALAFLMLLLTFGLAIAAWACWIQLAETQCRATNGGNWNPFQGYSYSFIFECVASGLFLLAAIAALLALLKLKKTPKAAPVPKEEVVYVEEPTYPITMDSPYMAPVTYDATYPITQPMYHATTPLY